MGYKCIVQAQDDEIRIVNEKLTNTSKAIQGGQEELYKWGILRPGLMGINSVH